MANVWRYIPFGTYSGAENMAIDETLLEAVIAEESANVIRFYRWQPTTATIGLHQSLSAEIDFRAAKESRVEVVRRITGGGAVLHDARGEITYAVICHIKDIPTHLPNRRVYADTISPRYRAILESLAVGLESLGVSIDVGKIHCPALLTQGKKLSGSAQTIRKNVLLQHGTVLLTVNPEFMYTILKAPIGVNYTKMVQSVRAKVTGILNDHTSLQDDVIVDALKEGFCHIFDMKLKPQPLSLKERKRIEYLKNMKYTRHEWLAKYP